jgi:hypothetical protein
MARTVIKTERFEARANVENKSVSLIFEDKQGNEVDIWLGDGSIFLVLGQIQKLIADFPEIEEWEIPAKYHPRYGKGR